MHKKTTILLVSLITLLGFAVRLSFIAGVDFPLHDGGFFYVMIGDLVTNGFRLPVYTTYNHAAIPFVYPPLGIYITGVIEYLTGAKRLQLLLVIPLLINTLSIPAFFYLAREFFEDEWIPAASTLVFSLLPMGYKWQILGGGITRSFGSLFGIIALTHVARFVRRGRSEAGVLGALFCGLKILSHPEMAWVLFYSIGFLVIIELFRGGKRVFYRAVLVVLGTIATILPWVTRMYDLHGKDLLLPLADSGFSRWEDVLMFFLLEWSGEILFPVFTFLSLIGIGILIKKKDWYPGLWLPIIFVLQGRAADQRAVIPLALSSGVGVVALIRHFLSHGSGKRKQRNIMIISTILLLYSMIGSIGSVWEIAKPLPNGHLESFTWITEHTPADSRILVVTGKEWTQDNYSEWMAALTGRESVSVVQGYEWLPGFSERITRHDYIQTAYALGISDLIDWLGQNKVAADYLILPKWEEKSVEYFGSNPALHWNDALHFPGVKRVFENEAVLILDLKGAIG